MGTIHEGNVDALPEEEGEVQKLAQQPFMFYVKNLEATFKIIATKWGQFCIIGGIIYLYHLIWAMCGVNMFSS